MADTTTKFEHSDKITTRRKALFPSTADSGSDLGHMSPLHSSSSNSSFIKYSADDYLVLSGSDFEDTLSCDGSGSQLNPMHALLTSPLVLSQNDSKVNTPHDSTTVKVNSRLQKKKQNVAVDKCKARTALFPEDTLALSVKSFYPQHKDDEVLKRETPRSIPIVVTKQAPVRWRSKQKRSRKRGEINAGVMHKIKKKKIKALQSNRVLRAAMTIIKNSPLNEYLEEMTRKSIKPLTPVVSDKKAVEAEQDDDKENVSEERKFFKSKAAVKPNNDSSLGGGSLGSGNGQVTNNKRKAMELLLSPTSQMCDMASGLALSSPKRARVDLNKTLNSMPNKVPEAMNPPKLFPVFCGAKKNPAIAVETNPAIVSSSSSSAKNHKTGHDQMLLDAGQKRFGVTECPVCEYVYMMGDADEEQRHTNYHNGTKHFKFPGWKNERMVWGSATADRIIKIVPNDSKAWVKKASDIIEFINRDLGNFDWKSLKNAQVYFYIKKRTVVGCLVAEAQSDGHKMLMSAGGADLCSEESYPIKCGVARLWISETCRRQGLATVLMETLRTNFLYDYILQLYDIAIDAPTQAGKAFAAKYFKTDSFLIYL